MNVPGTPAHRRAAYRAHFDGERVLLDEPLRVAANTKLLITVLPEPEGAGEPETATEAETLRADWLRLSALRLAEAYADDEPDYPLSAIRERNPWYRDE